MRATLDVTVFITYALVIAALSLQPPGAASVGSYDKLAHLAAYALFAVLAGRLRLSRRRGALLCLGIVAYSGALELGQSFVPGREMSAWDLVANAVGVLVGALLSVYLIREAGPARNR